MTIPKTIHQHYIHKETLAKLKESQLEKTTEDSEPTQTINQKYSKRHYPTLSRYTPDRKNLRI